MTVPDVPAAATPASASTAAHPALSAQSRRSATRSWPWRRGAMLLAGAAQLITISALVGTARPPLTWAALLLAIAPGPLAAAAAWGPPPVNLAAGLAGIVVLIAGIIGAVTHTGLFFVPALVVLAIGTAMLWRERSSGSVT
jgi:hypothetical protein